ncbi:hypothetical protein GQ53DRAFT_538111 [Thozetella sp. PMI_491]|nr:hypothetical protein GQ53DRAFT_538111 [Thozetella sp. PMI_491]
MLSPASTAGIAASVAGSKIAPWTSIRTSYEPAPRGAQGNRGPGGSCLADEAHRLGAEGQRPRPLSPSRGNFGMFDDASISRPCPFSRLPANPCVPFLGAYCTRCSKILLYYMLRTGCSTCYARLSLPLVRPSFHHHPSPPYSPPLFPTYLPCKGLLLVAYTAGCNASSLVPLITPLSLFDRCACQRRPAPGAGTRAFMRRAGDTCEANGAPMLLFRTGSVSAFSQ